MKKILMVLTAVCLMTIAIAGCGGSGVTPSGAGAVVEPAPMPTPDAIIDDEEKDVIIDEGEQGNDGGDYGDAELPAFLSVTGIVVNIEIIEGLRHIEIEDADGNPAVFVLSEETVFPFSPDFAVGDEVTGWYDSFKPMIMIYPPQYTIVVLASRMGDDRNITVDRFVASDISHAKYLVSQDGMFAFTTDENTEIVLEDGQDFSEGELEGRKIVVIYGISTRSIPGLATADKLIVLFEDISPFA